MALQDLQALLALQELLAPLVSMVSQVLLAFMALQDLQVLPVLLALLEQQVLLALEFLLEVPQDKYYQRLMQLTIILSGSITQEVAVIVPLDLLDLQALLALQV